MFYHGLLYLIHPYWLNCKDLHTSVWTLDAVQGREREREREREKREREREKEGGFKRFHAI